MEGGGTVAAIGAGVTNVNVGERVAYTPVRGSYAQYHAVPAWRLAKIPNTVPMRDAVTLMMQGMPLMVLLILVSILYLLLNQRFATYLSFLPSFFLSSFLSSFFVGSG